VLAKLADPAAQAAYHAANYTGGQFLPGVYERDGGLVFQFYHAFPVWLALFGDGAGPQAAVYALTLLSVASLLYFQRLAHLLTGSANAGLVAGLLLAVNPLHAFFSRFPVTEVPTLAFSLMAFVLLVDAWRSNGADGSRRWMVLSAGAMACLFFTRISGFQYVPFLVAMAIAAIAFDPQPARRRTIIAWVALSLVAFAASVVYGLRWSGPYSTDIYQLSFAPLLGKHWVALVAVVSMAMLAAWIGAAQAAKRPELHRLLQRALSAGLVVLPWIGVAIVAFALFRAWRLGYTDAYASHPWIGPRFGLVHQGLRSMFSTSIVAIAVYLSPFVFAAYLFAGFRARRWPALAMLLLFCTAFLGFAALLQWVLGYQPYYARYLLSEIVPYALLLVVCTWARLAPEAPGAARGYGLALLLGGVTCAGLSLAQIGKNEHEGVAESIEAIAAHADGGDLVIVDGSMASPNPLELRMPLAYWKRLNVANVTPAQLADSDYMLTLAAPFDDAWLLTNDGKPRKGFEDVESVRFREVIFDRGAMPPVATAVRHDARIRILRMQSDVLGGAGQAWFGTGHRGNALLRDGWSTPEGWGVWSSATSATLALDVAGLEADAADAIEVTLVGRAFVPDAKRMQRIAATVAGVPMTVRMDGPARSRATLVAMVPAERVRDGKLDVVLSLPDAVSPATLGLSGDRRTLAFGLERLSLRVIEAKAPAMPAH